MTALVSPADPAAPAVPPSWPSGQSILLFDCLAPFFAGLRDGEREGGAINWSKIPFACLERDGLLDPTRADTVLRELDGYLATMAGLGYNAVALDDLAHLVVHDFYPDPLRRKLASYRRLYERACAAIKARGLRLFVLTDYMFFNPAIERRLRASGQTPADLFAETVRRAFATYPEIDGIVLRIGESDGVDVQGDFTSRLTIERPCEARALLRRLLPLCEQEGKTLVVRTWTLGAYQVGDLMWNRRTYDAVFGGIDSPRLVVSLKYGDADFFRYLAINPLFFHGPHRKLIELQCRREYEGMGEYPSFVGWLYARYLAALRERASNVVGIFAVQGGGWAPFAKLAYCGDCSLWNELNTYATVKLVTTGAPVEEIVAAFCRTRGIADVDRFLRLLALSDEAIEEGLYVREFAARPVYFRRVRIPPLAWIFWNNVTTNGLVGRVHRYRVRDRQAAVAEGHRAVETVREMLGLARQLGLPDGGLRFQLDTFAILAHLREVLFSLDSPETHARLARLLPEYRERHPRCYQFDYAPQSQVRLDRVAALLVPLLPLLIRDQMTYRRRDRLMLNRHVTRLKARLARRLHAHLPRFVDKQGMASDVLLR